MCLLVQVGPLPLCSKLVCEHVGWLNKGVCGLNYHLSRFCNTLVQVGQFCHCLMLGKLLLLNAVFCRL
jgi:hypothetical protein